MGKEAEGKGKAGRKKMGKMGPEKKDGKRI